MTSPPRSIRPRLLVLNQYYWPGVEATAHLLTELCEALADEYDVTVITGLAEDTRPGRGVRNGVEIVRVRSTRYVRQRLTLRGVNYFTYVSAALRRGLAERRPDLVLCLTDPPFLGAAAYTIARRFRVPLVVVIQDVFPEIAVRLGQLKNAVLVRWFERLVQFYVRRAARVVVIGNTMRRRIAAKGLEPRRIQVIPNWVETETIRPHAGTNDWAAEHGLDGRFVVMHSGNVGHSQDLDSLVEAATFLRDLHELEILIIGFGARHGELTALAERLEARQVRFLPYQPRSVLSQSLSAADIHVVGLASGLSGLVVPSRLYGILATGRPVIVSAEGDCESAQIVQEARCGIVVPPGDPGALAGAIRSAHEGNLDLRAMGARARAWALAEGDRSVAVSRYRALLREVRAGR